MIERDRGIERESWVKEGVGDENKGERLGFFWDEKTAGRKEGDL